MSSSKTRLGIVLIVIGSVSATLILFWSAWEKIGPLQAFLSRNSDPYGTEALLRQRPDIQAPRLTGSSELKDYYRKYPRDKENARKKIDSSLWFSDYYTNPEGYAWTKDSNTEGILNETKKGESEYSTEKDGNEKPAIGDSLQKAAAGKPIHVEFWESPVNYKGYKINGNNLILFGIDPSDTLRFERHEEGVWMYHGNGIYLLKPTTEFSPFEPVRIEENPGMPELKTVN